MPNEPLWIRLLRSSNMRRYLLGPLAVFAGLTWGTSVWAQLAPGVTERSFAVSDVLDRSASEVRERIGARTSDHDYVSEVRLTADGEVIVRGDADMTHGGGLCASKSGFSFKLARSPVFPRFVFQHGRLQEMRDLTGNLSIPAGQLITVLCIPVRRDPDVAAWVVFGPWSAVASAAHTPETIARARVRAELARLGQPPPRGVALYAAHPPAGVQVHVQAPGRALITVNLGRDKITKRSDLVRVEVANGRIRAILKAPENFVSCWTGPDRSFHCGATAAPL